MKKKINVLIISLLLVGIAGCASAPLESKKNVFVVEYGQQIETTASTYIQADKDVLKDTKIKIKKATNEKEKDYVAVGTYKAQAQYNKDIVKFKIKVKDTEKPKFIDFKDSIEIEASDGLDPATLFKAEDLSGASIKVKEANKKLPFVSNVVGDYAVNVIATDKYKNKVTKKATIRVIPKKEVVVEAPTSPDTDTGDVAASNGQGDSNNTPGHPGRPNNGGGAVTPPAPAPTVCDQPVGNSGQWWTTHVEADNWAYAQATDPNSPYCLRSYTSWGNDICGYTIHWG